MLRLALSFLLVILAAPAQALGLGAAHLQSWFGQPLKITVPLVLEGGTPPDIGCFSISDTSGSGMGPPEDTALHLDAAGSALLITSRSPVQNLILEFAIAADCGASHVARRYSLLLDPPPAITPAVAETVPAESTPVAARTRQATAETRTARTKVPARAARHTQRLARPSRPAARRHARVAQAAPPPRSIRQTHREKPQLRLSSDSGMPLGGGNLVLQMDTTLMPTLAPPSPAAAPANMEAQAAALRQTLNGLQKELDQLRRRNAELQARLAAPPPPAPAPHRSFGYGWGVTVLSLLLAAAALAWALHRHRRLQPQADLPAVDEPRGPALKIALPTEAEGAWCELPAMPPPDEAATPEHAAASPNRPPAAKRPESHDAEAYPFHGRRVRDTGTEVNESAVDRAEVFLAFGHADLAIHLLEEHLAENPTESPVPWLLLLELLEREGLKKEYQEARLSCKVHFNLQVADLDESTGSHSLEDFPHILAEVGRRWNTADIAPYLDNLLRDDRGGMRRGFDPGTFRDILFLRQLVEAH